MPTYQYYCHGCGKTFEVFNERMSDHEQSPECPHCKSDITEQDWNQGGPDWSIGRSRTN